MASRGPFIDWDISRRMVSRSDIVALDRPAVESLFPRPGRFPADPLDRSTDPGHPGSIGRLNREAAGRRVVAY
jgi:hypothetical protein